jgi:hypothetical protein
MEPTALRITRRWVAGPNEGKTYEEQIVPDVTSIRAEKGPGDFPEWTNLWFYSGELSVHYTFPLENIIMEVSIA